MAITNARMQIKRGNESEFDSEKMLPGEWALSIDKKIVRICVAPNVCIRMATYDAFEVDMAKIEKILEECQTIEEVVKRINTEVSSNLDAVVEYTNQAKQYRDEAKTFRDEAEQFSPDGYVELQETVASNTAKIDTIIEKAELNIKNTASGENIHLTDSANGKNVGFGLYGKAEQKQYSGKNLLNLGGENIHTDVATCVYEEPKLTVTKTATSSFAFVLYKIGTVEELAGKTIYAKGAYSGGTGRVILGYADADGTNRESVAPKDATNDFSLSLVINANAHAGKVVAIWFYADVSKTGASGDTGTYTNVMVSVEENAEYEPYVGGTASPNPDYPQEITVSGSDGSVEVVSCGKNLLQNTAITQTINGVDFVVNEDKSVAVNGTASARTSFILGKFKAKASKEYILSGVSTNTNGAKIVFNAKTLNYPSDSGSGKTIYSQTEIEASVYIEIPSGATVSNLTFYPMIRLASDTDATYKPHTETTSTIPTPDGLCGIKASSGGNYTDENGQQWITDEIVKYADGSGQRIQRIQKAVFDGSETWNYLQRTDRELLFTNALNGLGKGGQSLVPFMCDYFKSYNGGVHWEGYNGTFPIMLNTATSNTQCSILAKVGTYGSADTWKEWLTSNPITVYYELAEPIITDLSAEEIAEIEKLYTFYPITNISNDADCGMTVTYLCDAKNYIDNRLALIESAMLNNI